MRNYFGRFVRTRQGIYIEHYEKNGYFITANFNTSSHVMDDFGNLRLVQRSQFMLSIRN